MCRVIVFSVLLGHKTVIKIKSLKSLMIQLSLACSASDCIFMLFLYCDLHNIRFFCESNI